MPDQMISADRARRDLQWVLQHTPILRDHRHDHARWIGSKCLRTLRTAHADAIEAIPDALLQPARGESRSGRYFEALLVALIKADPQLELLAHDLQVQDERRTIGAFDLLVRRPESPAVVHLELAFKQYLHRGGDPANTEHWVGPRGRDRLDRKMRHMQGHQLKLGSTHAGRAVLESMGITGVTPHALMAGWLFIHRDEYLAGRLPRLPRVCAATPELGWWCTEHELNALVDSDTSWRALPPNHSVAPLNADDCDGLPTPDWPEVQTQVAGGHPCLVAEVHDRTEVSRGWIVKGD